MIICRLLSSERTNLETPAADAVEPDDSVIYSVLPASPTFIWPLGCVYRQAGLCLFPRAESFGKLTMLVTFWLVATHLACLTSPALMPFTKRYMYRRGK